MAKDIIKVVGFEKDITLCVAETKGFSSAQGLEIMFDQTPNSTTEISGLLTGKWHVALTTATTSLPGMKARVLTAKFTTFLSYGRFPRVESGAFRKSRHKWNLRLER